jgi:hypothetical protein
MEKQRIDELFEWNEQNGDKLLKWVKRNVTKDNVNDQVFLYQGWLKYNNPTGVYTSNSARWSMLHYSVDHGYYHAILHLLSIGADIELQTEYGNTALLLACMNDSAHIIELLLNSGANPNVISNNHKSSFQIAYDYNHHLNTMHKLIDFGAKLPRSTEFIEKFQCVIDRRHNRRCAIITFIGLHKFKRAKNQNNKDVMRLIGKHIWSLRFSLVKN